MSSRECEVDGVTEDTYGGEHYWHCGRPGTITVRGTLMCEDHAGEEGYGPKQEEYGFDPGDGHDKVRIRYGMSVSYIAGSTREDTEEIDRAEWESMTPAEQQAYLDGTAETCVANSVDSWAYVEEGDAR